MSEKSSMMLKAFCKYCNEKLKDLIFCTVWVKQKIVFNFCSLTCQSKHFFEDTMITINPVEEEDSVSKVNNPDIPT